MERTGKRAKDGELWKFSSRCRRRSGGQYDITEEENRQYHQWWLKMLNRQTVVPQPNERKSEVGEEKMEKARHVQENEVFIYQELVLLEADR